MATHRVQLGDGGRLEIVRSSPPEDRDRLRATLATLRTAAGAGVVEVLAAREADDELEVVLAFAGRSPVAPLDAREVARIGASVAAIVADLHLRGLCHGALEPEHVLVDATGVVRLCGLGDARDGTTGGDVLALGDLLCAFVDESETSDAAVAVRAVAVRCRTADATTRPTMSAMAAALSTAGGSRQTLRVPPERRRARPRASRAPLAAIALACVIVLAVLVVASRPARARTNQQRSTRPTSSTSSPATTTTTVARAERVWPVDATTTTLVGVGDHWTFGGAGSRAMLGDWDCDGTATPALVDRAGGVWVIDAWPHGDATPARFVTTVDGVVDASVVHSDGCDTLSLTTRDGRHVTPSLRPPGA